MTLSGQAEATRPRAVRTILQMETAECGAVCLAMVLAALGRHESLDAVRDSCGASRDGTSVASLIEAARRSGLEAEAYRREVEDLGNLPLPQILFWNFDHFVVLETIGRSGFVIHDPAHGRRHVDRAEFGRSFTGITLAFAPGPHFERRRPPPGTIAQLSRLLRGSRDGFGVIVLTSLIAVAVGALVPGFTRIFIDDYLIQGHGDWLIPLIGAMVVVAALRGTLAALQARGTLLLHTKLATVLNARLVARLFALPHEFLVRRSPVELSGRGQLAGQLASTISGPLVLGTSSLIGLAVYLGMMVAYSPALALLVVILSLINVLILARIRDRIDAAARRLQMAAGQAHATNVQGVALLEDHRATGTEAVLFNRMIEAAVRLINAEQASGRTTRLMAALPFAMSRLITLSVLGAGALQVIWTDMTLGMLLGFLMLAELFAGSLAALAGVATAIGQSASALQRLGDMLDHRGGGETVAPPPAARATGALALNELGFAYANGRTILSGIALAVAPGETIAIMGGSGSGKSTLAALLAGLITPTSGTIRFGTDAEGAERWQGSCRGIGYVDQTPFLPAGPLRAALTLWNPGIAEPTLEQALADAEMTSCIAGRPGGLDGRIAEAGADFSGGERQRLAIARALAIEPQILVLDEATSALDEATELSVLDNLRRRGATIVLFTNRMSAIRHCDRVLALIDGDLVPVPQESIYQPAPQPEPETV